MTKRTIGIILLTIGFAACFYGRPGLIVALLSWIPGTMLFAKSFVE